MSYRRLGKYEHWYTTALKNYKIFKTDKFTHTHTHTHTHTLYTHKHTVCSRTTVLHFLTSSITFKIYRIILLS
jgi:hypothetical protein